MSRKKVSCKLWKQQRHHLYRHFDKDGRLLYVGISLHALGRLRSHRDNSKWFDEIAEVKIAQFGNRHEALQAERLAVANEKPAHNRRLRCARHEGPPRLKRGERKVPQVNETKKGVLRM